MESSPGMKDVSNNDCVILQNCIIGLVQVVRQYNKEVAEILKKIGFTGNYVNPFHYMKQSIKGRVYVALYVDDNLMVGNPEAKDEVVKLLQQNGLVFNVRSGRALITGKEQKQQK